MHKNMPFSSLHDYSQQELELRNYDTLVTGNYANIFMKSKLMNRLNEHLHTIVGMYSQTFFTLNTFLYDACFDDWKEEKSR
jgi:hypothetical protein